MRVGVGDSRAEGFNRAGWGQLSAAGFRGGPPLTYGEVMDHHVASTSDADLVGRVDAALDREVAALEPWLTEVGDELLPFLAQAERAVGGGKRLRALLCLAAYEVAGGDSPVPEHVVDAAAALELFQGAALVHDDLMDASDTRRGEPSAHRALASASPRDSGRDAFGAGAAILLGDLLLTRSSTVLFDAVRRTPEGPGGAVSALYSDMATEVAVGQYLDLLASHAHWDDDVDLDRAFRVIRAKSARYSVEIPLALGATLAGADGLVGGSGRSGTKWGRPSSYAMTCSVSSATRSAPASRRATTCARASGRSWWHSPTRTATPPCAPGWRRTWDGRT